MNRRTLVLSALLFVLLTSHFLSYPVQKVNASSLLYEYYNTGDNYRIDIYSAYWEAQTFTPTTRHIITSVKIKVYRYGSPGIVTVSIRATDGSGHPTGADLTSNTFDGNALTTSSSGEWKEVALTSYLLNAGTKYAIVVRATSGDYFNCIFWRWDDSSPTYAGGNREKSSNSGSSWTTDSEDYMFEEWGNPLFTLSIQARKWDNSTVLVGAKVYIQNSTYSGYKTSSSTGWANFTGQYDASVKWWVVWREPPSTTRPIKR